MCNFDDLITFNVNNIAQKKTEKQNVPNCSDTTE